MNYQSDVTIALDVSTRYTGITILDNNTLKIILCNALKFEECETIFDKIDFAKKFFDATQLFPTRLVIEEPLMGFSKGESSAKTITTAFRFNGMISYVARESFKIDPVYVSASHARAVCGLKMQQRKKIGKSHKEQTFEAMIRTDLAHMQWPMKKSKKGPKVVDWAYDACDSYVIAKCGVIEKL